MERDGESVSTRPCCANYQSSCRAGTEASRVKLRFARPDQEHRALQQSPSTESNLKMTTETILQIDTVVMAMAMTAQMFWLPQSTVVAMIRAGLPALCRLAAVNALLVTRLYAVSREPLPEPIDQLYTRMAKSPVVRQAIMDDYRAIYGDMLDPVNRMVGRQVGTTDGQAREVIAAMLPAICQVLGQANAGGLTEYARLLHDIETHGLAQSGSLPEGAS